MPAHEARAYENLAHGLERHACLEGEVKQGTIPAPSGAILGEVARTPGLERPGDRWLEWAREWSTRQLRRYFLRRREEHKAQQPVVPVTAYVTLPVRDDMDRARVLVSRKAHAVMSMGQTVGVVFGEWLDDNDPTRVEGRARRLPDTAELPGKRYVPAEVDRAVRARSQDRCIVPYCDCEIWLHRSHRVAHAKGGSREAANTDLLCDYHHLLYELGLLRIEGPPDAPRFTDRHGRTLDARRPFEELVGELPVERPAVEDVPVGVRSLEERPVEALPVETRPALEPPFEEPPVEVRPVEAPLVRHRADEAPPAHDRPVEASHIEARPAAAMEGGSGPPEASAGPVVADKSGGSVLPAEPEGPVVEPVEDDSDPADLPDETGPPDGG